MNQPTQPILCHLLIGLPGSGKSTFARKLQEQIPDSVVISTDTIRDKLFGDQSVQGDWNRVENEAIYHIKLALNYNQPVIYDATNARDDWRSSFLVKLDHTNTEWMAWWIKTPIEICKQWNKKRSHQVPDHVIDTYAEYLAESLPSIEEGFIAIREIVL